MTTRSVGPTSAVPGARALLPAVIRTRATAALPKKAPRNDGTSAVPWFGAYQVPSDWLAESKNVIDVVFARSTSLKIAPNPRVAAGVVVPGWRNATSTTFDPSAVN